MVGTVASLLRVLGLIPSASKFFWGVERFGNLKLGNFGKLRHFRTSFKLKNLLVVTLKTAISF